MMLLNFPDIGFCNSQITNLPDKFYTNIKDSVIQSVSIRQAQLNEIQQANSELEISLLEEKEKAII